MEGIIKFTDTYWQDQKSEYYIDDFGIIYQTGYYFYTGKDRHIIRQKFPEIKDPEIFYSPEYKELIYSKHTGLLRHAEYNGLNNLIFINENNYRFVRQLTWKELTSILKFNNKTEELKEMNNSELIIEENE